MVVTEGRTLLAAWMSKDPARSQRFVARMLCVTQPAVSQWLRGVSRPEPPQREGLSTLAGIPTAAWLTKEERSTIRAASGRIGDAFPKKTGS